MSNLHETLQLAVGHHSAGRLSDAADLYQQILAADPHHADATHLLGVVAHQSGDPPTAVTLIKAAIQLDGERAFYHNNLGQAQQSLGRSDAAAASFQRAIELDARCCQAYYNLAMLRRAEADWVSTVELCRRATAIKPDYADAVELLATALWAQGDRNGAITCYEQLLANDPNDLTTIETLGILQRELGNHAAAADRFCQGLAIDPGSDKWQVHLGDVSAVQHDWAAAVRHYEAALAANPRSAAAHMHLGSAWQVQGDLKQAIAHYRRVIEIEPERADAHYNLGTAEQKLGRLSEAAEHFRAALAADPRMADASLHLGTYHQQLGELDLALHYYDRALETKQVSAKAHFNRGMILLAKGRWHEGWQEYEWRTKILESPTRRFDHLPRWDGGPRPSATLLVHWEQGLGDTLQFIRYVPLISGRVSRVITLVPRPLARILRQAGFADVYDDEHALPEIDCQIPLLSLPGIAGTTPANVPAEVPYLKPDETLVEKWRDRLAPITGFRIGVCWQGSARNLIDKTRSLPLAAFEPVAKLPSVQLVSLQKREGLEQVDQLRDRFTVHTLGGDWDEAAGPFMDSAAVMQNLDLVITSDTAVAHLAGALGVRVWVLLSTRPDWRWMQDRGDTPWYPTMRLMRQSRLGDWDELLARVAHDVAALQASG